MTVIRYSQLPHDAAPPATNKVATDALTTTYSTLEEIVNAGRPYASQAEAEAGTSQVVGMNPLRTAQAITAIGAGLYATVAEGALATTAVQPATLAAVQVPTGGTAGQVLSKISSTANDVTWSDAGMVTATEWNNAVAYGLGDYASYSSGLYRANVANTNKIPGVDTEWDVVIAPFTGGTLTLPLVTAASTTGAAGFNIPSGTAPTSPVNGDIFRNASAVFIRMSGSTYQFAFLNAAQTWTGSQTFALTKDVDVSLTLANGVNVGPTLPTTGSFIHITGPTGAFSIASLAGVYDGQNIRIYNNTSQVMTVKHQDAVNEATAFKRIITPTGADITAKVVTLHYSVTAARWIVTAYHS